MKKAGKVILYLLLSLFALVLVLMVIAASMQDRIAKLAIDEVSKSTNIPITIEDINFSLIRNFPMATLECSKLAVRAPENNSAPGDTLANVGKMFISVELKPLLNSVFKIREIEVENAKIYYAVDTAGVSNYDFLMDTTTTAIDTADNAIYLNIKALNLQNVQCVYSDQKLKATADLLIERLELSGLIDNNRYLGEVKAEAKLSNCSLDSTNLHLLHEAAIKLDLDYRDSLLTVNAADLTLDEDARLALSGSVTMNKQLPANLKLKAEQCQLGGLSKYIPEHYFADYGIQNLAGELGLEATVQGNLGDSILPRADILVALSGGALQYQNYPVLRNISFVGSASNGDERTITGSSLKIDSFSFETDSSKASLSGTIVGLDKPQYDLLSILNLDLNELAPFVPDSLVTGLGGKLGAVVSTHGTFPGSLTDSFLQSLQKNSTFRLNAEDLSFSMDSTLSVQNLNGQFEYKPGQLKLSDLNCSLPTYNMNLRNAELDAAVTGDFMKPESLAFQISQFALATDSCQLQLSGQLINPMAPDYLVNGQLSLDLNEIEKYLPAGTVESMSGKVLANFSSKAKIDLETVGDDALGIAFEKTRINLSMGRVNVQMADSLTSVKDLTGKVNYAADSLWLGGLTLNYMGVQFGADSTSITRLYSAVLQNKAEEMKVHGKFSVDKLDYSWVEKLMARLEEEPTPSGPAADPEPARYTYKVNGRLKANQLNYEGNLFENIDSKFLVKENHYVFDSLKMDAFDGTSLSSIKIDFTANEQMEIYFKTNVKQMDVTKLITGFHDYMDMDDIKAENVQGKVSTTMDGKIVVDKDYNPVYNSLMLKGDLKLENGALINVKPVMEIEKIPGVGLKNMDNLRFSALSSSIFLLNIKLYIPKTEIRSSSFDAMFLGMWSFGDDYAYHIRMFLGEVLSSKSKANLKKQMKENGFEDEDESDLTKGRSSIYLVSKLENGKEKAWLDNKKDRVNMEAKVKMQEGALKFTFHPSFVTYDTE
ncbi:AsmA family protein [Mangrovibacterium diazotrophicum]|uniref:AsmA-like protein n=1 Tax=Mangrovibacterium diazotrophicum TaxID=1261403 RepID=A0A419WAG0_9BACT|nr:AsmA family protein [Mangrovibacterium diazotrophicum]RKD92392.1 AsmA-like protein [Mangrovibacterium diazotrophicum]